MSKLLSIFVGFVVGCIFRLCSLPIPAPAAIEGILGIVGIYLGYVLIEYWKK